MTGYFSHEGFDLAFLDRPPAAGGPAETVLLIHGFASSFLVNWVNPGWVKTLSEAGYRVVAFDHRGHGTTTKSYDPEDYTPEEMAGDAAALLMHLGIPGAHVMGYSMGARVAAFMALDHRDIVSTLIFGGLGFGMVEGVGDWDVIADALLAPDPGNITDARGKTFRAFADQTRSDRRALAACITASRTLVSLADLARITQPTLVAVGTNDDLAGSPERLTAAMPNAVDFEIVGRDHMLAVGDRTFKARALEFLRSHPVAAVEM